MNKYHVKPNGDTGKCRAKHGKCPFGDASEHYGTQEQAQKAYELSQGGSFGMVSWSDGRPAIANLTPDELKALPRNTMVVFENENGTHLYSLSQYAAGIVYLDEPWSGEDETDYDIDDYYFGGLQVGIATTSAIAFRVSDTTLDKIPSDVKKFLANDKQAVQDIDTKTWTFTGEAQERFEAFTEAERVKQEKALQVLTLTRDDTWEEHVPTAAENEEWDMILYESYGPGHLSDDELQDYRRYLYSTVRAGHQTPEDALRHYDYALSSIQTAARDKARRNSQLIVENTDKMLALSREQANFTEGSQIWSELEDQKTELGMSSAALRASIPSHEQKYEELTRERKLLNLAD